jgi:hypothetical protein
MSLNWGSIGSTLSGLTSSLSALGISATSMPGILNAIGLSANPNQSEEIALCGQILMASYGSPALVSALALKLATEQGIPASAAALAMTLAQPGADVPSRVLQIEQIIRQGG